MYILSTCNVGMAKCVKGSTIRTDCLKTEIFLLFASNSNVLKNYHRTIP